MKATAIAPSNIAFIKYWGKKDDAQILPENASISMNLSDLRSITTVEFSESYKTDTVNYDGLEDARVTARVSRHLDRIRERGQSSFFAKVMTQNSFPTGTGLSSSASGFAALTLAGVGALGLELSQKDLSILARFGSGSACRSIPDGFVEWLDGDTSDTSYASSLFPPEYWDITDIVTIVSTQRKDVSSTEGMARAKTSQFWTTRKEHMRMKIEEVKNYIKQRDFTAFGELVEAEALEMHAIMLTSVPSLIYWQPGTLEVMKCVKLWRSEGLPCYFTINTGQDVHILCQKKDASQVAEKLSSISFVQKTMINQPSRGAYLTDSHLF